MKKIKILQYAIFILVIILLLIGAFAGYRSGYMLEDIEIDEDSIEEESLEVEDGDE